MKIKKFEALDMQEALRLVKDELGPNAVLVSTRSIKKGKGFFGLFSRSIVEVVAAVEDGTGKSIPGKKGDNGSGGADPFKAAIDQYSMIQPLHSEIIELKEAIANIGRSASGHNHQQQPVELVEIKSMLNNIIKKASAYDYTAWPKNLVEIHQGLIERRVMKELADRFIDEIRQRAATDDFSDIERLRGYLRAAIEESIETRDIIEDASTVPGQPKIVSFVGPTGVGKTTTIAKIAAINALERGRKVALITMDTYRIAAVEQLKVYSKIIGIPIEIALTPEDLKTAINNFWTKDLILIDTAGRSQYDDMKLAELTSFVNQRMTMENVLVLSSMAHNEETFDAIAKFGTVPIDGLIFTKIDETKHFGTMLNVALFSKKPICYLSVGQKVPDDIVTADRTKIADLVLNGGF